MQAQDLYQVDVNFYTLKSLVNSSDGAKWSVFTSNDALAALKA